ncbi:hypothetical protein [Paraburkholderia xenovorans]|uniref:hypothetical protein n=1 Tax=Paraburkholderia xenovorans TaxID=36873 RepID=UPI0038B87DEA
MTRRFRPCVHNSARVFMPVQAILGYPNRYAKEPAVAIHRQKFVDFSRKLHAVLAPLLGQCYSLHEELTVLTLSGFAGPTIRADCVVLTDFGVFVIRHVQWSGHVSQGLDADSLHVVTEEGKRETYPSPLTYAAPAVHFLSALLAEFRCPVEIIAIIDNEMSEIGFSLSTSLLKLSEFHHFLRVRRERTRERYQYFDVRAMGERLRTGCRLMTSTRPAQSGGQWPIEGEQ